MKLIKVSKEKTVKDKIISDEEEIKIHQKRANMRSILANLPKLMTKIISSGTTGKRSNDFWRNIYTFHQGPLGFLLLQVLMNVLIQWETGPSLGAWVFAMASERAREGAGQGKESCQFGSGRAEWFYGLFKTKIHHLANQLKFTVNDSLLMRPIRFRFDGQPISVTDTPARLETEDGDRLDVLQQQAVLVTE